MATSSNSVIPSDSVDRLRRQISGLVLEPNDEGYDAARTVWNGMIDRYPTVIVQPDNTQDVVDGHSVRAESHNFLDSRGWSQRGRPGSQREGLTVDLHGCAGYGRSIENSPG